MATVSILVVKNFYTGVKLSQFFGGGVLKFVGDGKCFFSKAGSVEQKEFSISRVCGMHKYSNVPWNNISDSSNAEHSNNSKENRKQK